MMNMIDIKIEIDRCQTHATHQSSKRVSIRLLTEHQRYGPNLIKSWIGEGELETELTVKPQN